MAKPVQTIVVSTLRKSCNCKFSWLQQIPTVCYTRPVPSTGQCRHSSLYYQKCNELLIFFYIIYVTSAAYTFCHFSARLYSTRLRTGFLRTSKEEDIFYLCVS